MQIETKKNTIKKEKENVKPFHTRLKESQNTDIIGPKWVMYIYFFQLAADARLCYKV